MSVINREDAIAELMSLLPKLERGLIHWTGVKAMLEALPPAQSEQTKMIREIREWINSGNRGSMDYFIVDKIEEIIKKYE